MRASTTWRRCTSYNRRDENHRYIGYIETMKELTTEWKSGGIGRFRRPWRLYKSMRWKVFRERGLMVDSRRSWRNIVTKIVLMVDKMRSGILVILVGFHHQNMVFILWFGRYPNNFIHYRGNCSVRFSLGYNSLGFTLYGFWLPFYPNCFWFRFFFSFFWFRFFFSFFFCLLRRFEVLTCNLFILFLGWSWGSWRTGRGSWLPLIRLW